jgi:hypothetical protein
MQCSDIPYSHWFTGWTVRSTHPSWEKRCFSSLKHPKRLWGLPSLLFSGSHGSLVGLKCVRRDVEQSPSFSAKVKNEWGYTLTLSICLHGVDRDNFAFYECKHEKYKNALFKYCCSFLALPSSVQLYVSFMQFLLLLCFRVVLYIIGIIVCVLVYWIITLKLYSVINLHNLRRAELVCTLVYFDSTINIDAMNRCSTDFLDDKTRLSESEGADLEVNTRVSQIKTLNIY